MAIDQTLSNTNTFICWLSGTYDTCV